MDKKYPLSLFISGFIMNLILRYFYLFVPSLILIVVGIWIDMCKTIGFVLLLIDIIISLIEQLSIRKTTLEETDNEDFKRFQEAILSENWQDNVKDLVDEKIKEAD